MSETKEKTISLQPRISDPTKSYLRKYQELTVGDGNLLSLIKYELLIMLFGSIPGALGFLLRKYFYKLLFKKVGKNVLFGKHISITNPGRISIGNNSIIGDYSELDAKYKKGEIVIGDNVSIGRNTCLRTRNGIIKIGENSALGANCILVAHKTLLNIERYHLMGSYCYLTTGHHEYADPEVPIKKQSVTAKEILIEEDVWIGSRVTVLGGGIIRKGCVIGACSFVKREIEEYSVAVGTPAKKIASRK